MRRSKEISLLVALLLGAVAFVLWYVIDRRAENQAAPVEAESKAVGPFLNQAGASQPFVELGGENEGKTIDFSSGQPVVKDTPEDRAAIKAALKEINEAVKNVTFEAPKTEPKKP